MASTNGKLTLDDISDQRAYERERVDFRTHVIALKKCRRVHVGPIVTLVFENRDTIRFQIQEMARVEKLITDEAIQGELDTYNTLIPEAGQLCDQDRPAPAEPGGSGCAVLDHWGHARLGVYLVPRQDLGQRALERGFVVPERPRERRP